MPFFLRDSNASFQTCKEIASSKALQITRTGHYHLAQAGCNISPKFSIVDSATKNRNSAYERMELAKLALPAQLLALGLFDL